MSQLLQLDLVRSWASYFKTKGGVVPRAPAEIVPVVIMDDASKGPYPPYRAWHFGAQTGPVAGQFSYVGVKNADVAGTKGSVMVVDYILVVSPTPADVVPVITNDSSITFAVFVAVEDCAEEKDQAPTNAPAFANVVGGVQSIVGGLGTQRVPMTGAVERIDGPWSLGPQGIFAVRPLIVNAIIGVYFRGRYYPPL